MHPGSEGRGGRGISFLPSCQFSPCDCKAAETQCSGVPDPSGITLVHIGLWMVLSMLGRKGSRRVWTFKWDLNRQMDKVRRPKEGVPSTFEDCVVHRPSLLSLYNSNTVHTGKILLFLFYNKVFEAILTESWQVAKCRPGCELLYCLLFTPKPSMVHSCWSPERISNS